MAKLIIEDWGLVGYQDAWDRQEQLLNEKTALKKEGSSDAINHHLIFVEHPPVFTIGKSGKEEHLLLNNEELGAKGIDYIKTNRGGDITFHGPGQMVVYPILDLEKLKTDIGWYLRSLEDVVIKTIAEFNIIGERSQGETGVWIEANLKGKERKICAMGVRCSRWVTMHGIALNVNTPLSYFDYIIPCGISNKKVASMQEELGRTVAIELVKKKFVEHFNRIILGLNSSE
jgi:lipoyl(octanoyl) transferase